MAVILGALASVAAAPQRRPSHDGPLPDLVLTGYGVAQDGCRRFQGIFAEVKNQGSADAGTFGVLFAIDGHHPSTRVTVQGLAAGQSIYLPAFNATWHRPVPGDHYFQFAVDPEDRVQEGDEANNAQSVPLICEPRSVRPGDA